MKNYLTPLSRTALFTALCGTFLFSCSDPEEAVTPVAPTETTTVSDEIKSQFIELGFDASDLVKDGENYVVEGDIVITPEALSGMLSSEPTIVNNALGEQYRTFNLVSRNLRTIRIRSTNSNSRVLLAVDRAINNYNALGLTFGMVRVGANSPAEITVRVVGGGGGRAGFPPGNGLPFNDVQIGVGVFDNDDDVVEHVMTHEIGHCLGLRHSDWYDRSLSCGDRPNNVESQAIPIPGTVRFDAESVMNACFSSTETGEFSQFDRVALRELY